MSRGFEEVAQAFYDASPAGQEGETLRARIKLGPGGRIVVPAAMREALGVAEGQSLMATMEGGEMRLVSMAESVRRAQSLVRGRIAPGRSLSDELIAERREEVRRELGDG